VVVVIDENLSALRKDLGMTLKAAAAVCSVSAALRHASANGSVGTTGRCGGGY
jgi:hypothetical protein